jgi:ornithine cyclodeaminase/alanine dehydrogenase
MPTVSIAQTPTTGPARRDGAQAVPLFVPSDVVEQVLAWPEMVARLRAAYAAGIAAAANPPRVVARGERTWFRALASAPATSRYMGAKVFGMSRSRAVSYVVALMDQENGGFAGFVDAHHVTACRTGATSAVAVDKLATPGPKRLAVLGSGTEATSHIRAIAAVRPLSGLAIFSPTAANREALAAKMAAELGVPAQGAASPEEAVAGADIVAACARAKGEIPILHGAWLRPGTVVVSIGSTLPEQREIDVSVVDVCDLIVCDTVEEVVEETGDMLAATAAGIDFHHKLGSLDALVRGELDARLAKARLPMFKSVGSAIQDIVIAELAFEKAIERGLALPFPAPIHVKRPKAPPAQKA